jgi:hypothetical protein
MTPKVLFQSAPLFEKRTVVELTENEMLGIDGGTTAACGAAATAVILVVGTAAAAVQIWQGGVAVGQWLYSVTH